MEERADILASLPETIEIEEDFDGDLSNFLSDEYGYCINGLKNLDKKNSQKDFLD